MLKLALRLTLPLITLIFGLMLGLRVVHATALDTSLALEHFTAAECFNLCWLDIEIGRSNINKTVQQLEAHNITHTPYNPLGSGIIEASLGSSVAVLYVDFRFQVVQRIAFHDQPCPLNLLASLGLPDAIETSGSSSYLIYSEGILISAPSAVVHAAPFVIEIIPREHASSIIAVQEARFTGRRYTWSSVQQTFNTDCL